MRSSTTYNTAGRPRIYICQGEPGGCSGVSIRMTRADEAVTAAVFERVSSMYGHEYGRPDYTPEEEIILLDAIADTNRRLQDLAIDRYCHHVIDRQLYLVVITRLRSRLDRLRRRLRSPALHLLTDSNPHRSRDEWDTLDPEERRLAINAVLDHAIVLPATAEGRANPASRFRFRWHHDVTDPIAVLTRQQRPWTAIQVNPGTSAVASRGR
jgi:hypothetical protein